MDRTISVATERRLDVLDVTDRVAERVPSALAAGTCSVFVRHTTAGVLVNEPEPGLLEDLREYYEHLVPETEYRHDAIDDNADAHLRASIAGASVTVPVRDGGLALGTWQSILLLECDGPRTREVVVTVTPAAE